MSRKSDQDLAMLVVILGVMQTMVDGRCFAKVELQRAIRSLYDDAAYAVQQWPIMCNMRWVRQKRYEFQDYIGSIDKIQYPAVELVKMAEQLVTDLQERNVVGYRADLVGRLRGPIDKLVEHVDRHGRNFPAWEESGRILEKLYEILEMRVLA